MRHPLQSLRSNTKGNVAIIAALMAVPLIASIGLGVDFYKSLSMKSRLDSAADAAALAAIATAKAYISANSQTQSDPGLTNNAVAAGIAQALKAFPANLGSAGLTVSIRPTVNVTRNGQMLNASVSYSGSTSASLGQVFGYNTLSLNGTSASSLTIGKYLDFYLLLDVSGSMGIPTSVDGQAQLAAINKDDASNYPTGCNFACHFSGYQGYTQSRTYNIPLRVDSVGYAVQKLLATATSTETLTNQYRIGVYPFIVHAIQAAALSSDFTASNSVAATFANYLDQGTTNGGMGSGGTHFEYLWSDLQLYLKTPGDGSNATAPLPFIFLVTDGMDNNQTYSPFTGSQPQLPNLSLCTKAKNAGYTVSVLYIPYVGIQNPNHSFAGDEDGKVNTIVNAGTIPPLLTSCASPGFFRTASSSTEIDNAMQAMFAQSLQSARLTN